MHTLAQKAAALAVIASFVTVGATAAFAQTPSPSATAPSPSTNLNTGSYVSPGTSPGTYTPGLPNTGDGGSMPENLALMLASALVALGGVTYLVKSYHHAA